MAVIKEEIISLLRELPDNATLVEIEIAIIENISPTMSLHSKKMVKKILKLKKLNPRYIQATSPIEKVRNSFYVERNFHAR
jgi:hypothetical protein